MGAIRTWVAPEITSIGRLPMRASLTPYPDEASARARGASAWVAPLNGTWRFALAPRPQAVPPNFAGDDFAKLRAARDAQLAKTA